MPQTVDARKTVGLLSLIAVAVFVADCLTPLGVPVYLGYVFPVLLALRLGRVPGLLMAGAATLLLFAGLFTSRGAYVPLWIGAVNRLIVSFFIWSPFPFDLSRSSLESMRRRFAVVVENAPDIAVIGLSNKGVVEEWNEGARQFFGWTEQEIVGKSMDVLFSEEDRAAGIPEKERREALATGRGIDDRWQVRRDGTRLWANGVVLPLSRRPNTSFVKIIRDMTERRQLIDELGRRVQELERSNKDLEQFSYVAAHDLQAPLRTLTTYGDLLTAAIDGGDRARVAKFLGAMSAAASRMRALIDDLLAYARAGGGEMRLEPVRLADVISDATLNLRSAIRDSQAAIAHDGLPTIFCDRSQMVQVFQNLFGNAIRYRSERPPTIDVTAALEGAEWLIRVSDNGIGMDADTSRRIFEPFQQGQSGKGGSGIGLAICRRIVERHGGHISVRSEPGKGSVFTLALPRSERP